MIKPEQVPKEAMEAAAVQFSNGRTTAQAIAAALNAWPGMEEYVNWPYGKLTHILLPLARKQENSDAE